MLDGLERQSKGSCGKKHKKTETMLVLLQRTITCSKMNNTLKSSYPEVVRLLLCLVRGDGPFRSNLPGL